MMMAPFSTRSQSACSCRNAFLGKKVNCCELSASLHRKITHRTLRKRQRTFGSNFTILSHSYFGEYTQ